MSHDTAACLVTPVGSKDISARNKLMSSVKRAASVVFADSPFIIPPSPMMKQLGFGTQVTVYRYKRQKFSGQANASPWAIKKSKLGRTRSLVIKRLTTEGEILRRLDHPNIIKFKKLTKTDEGEVCLSMESFGKGLDDYICQRQGTGEMFKARHIMKVAWSMANALNYLHNTIHLLHGDMKSGNVLVNRNFEEVKLCDFGVSIFLKDDLSGPKNPSDTYTGSEPWLSKELLNGNTITDKADIFAYGLVIWEMLALDVPHVACILETDENLEGSFTEHDVSNDSMNDEYYAALGTRPPLPDLDYPTEYKNVIGTFVCCTCEDYIARPNAAKIVESLSEYHPVEGNNKQVDISKDDKESVLPIEESGKQVDISKDDKENIVPTEENNKQVDISKDDKEKIVPIEENGKQVDISTDDNQKIVPTEENNKQVDISKDDKEKFVPTEENNKQVDVSTDDNEKTVPNVNLSPQRDEQET